MQVIIGEFAFIGGAAIATRDVPNFSLIVVVSTWQMGWMSAFGERLNPPLTGESVAVCPNTGERYVLLGNYVMREEVGI